MKIKIILSITIMIGVAVAVVFREVEQKAINRASAQLGGCSSYLSGDRSCGNNETCGLGTFVETAAIYNGPGYDGSELRATPCQGTSCGFEPGSQAYFNGYCCDQDGDLHDRTGSPCGGNDCNDNPATGGGNIYPTRPEVCDGIDNNCNGQIDEGFNQDGDGFTTCQGDCDDTNAMIYPGAPLGSCGGFALEPRDWNCNGTDDYVELGCWSPIVLDIAGNGFNLTNAGGGVFFDLNSDGNA